MEALTMVGILKEIKVIEHKTDNFSKRDFAITADATSQYPQHVPFQLVNARVNLIDGYPLGIQVKVHFTIGGKEYQDQQGETKYFLSLNAYKIEKVVF